jgi:hypothetical protein
MHCTVGAPESRDKSVAPWPAVRIVLHAIRPAAISFGREPRAGCRLANSLKDDHMHASLAFVNGAGSAGKDLRLLNTLLSTASKQPHPGSGKGKALDPGKSKDERQADEESKADTVSKPGGFKNDPDDPTNPNEVRERHLKKIKP